MTQEILKFSETNNGTNLLTQSEYNADAERLIGNAPGIARLKLVNKVLRQTSFISKNFADYLVQQVGGDVLDDSNDAVLLAKITACFATGIPISGIINMPTSAVPTGFLKCNGAAVSRTTYSSLFNALVTVPGFSAQTFTVTLATPAVFTKTAHGFANGERLRLTTTGALPTGLSLLTDYFVKVIDANTFNLQTIADVLAGTLVNTSGSQSGTHSYQRSLWGLGDGSTTFNVPDLRGAFSRAWDDGRGIDAARVIASLQMDAFQDHRHDFYVGNTASSFAHNSNNNQIALADNAGGRVLQSTAPGSQDIIGNPKQGVLGAVLKVATETRPINYAMMPVIKY